jgi:hypothetical protein
MNLEYWPDFRENTKSNSKIIEKQEKSSSRYVST